MVDVRDTFLDVSRSVQRARVAVEAMATASVEAGSPRQVIVTCSAQGVPETVRVSPDFAGKATTEELATTIRSTLAAAQQAAERHREEAIGELPSSPEALSERVDAATTAFLAELNVIRTNIARLRSQN